MSVLVTGGAGYIGSHTVKALRARGDDVVVIDTLELGSDKAVGDAELVVGDIADGELVTGVVRDFGVQAIVHFAAYKAAGESFENPGRYFTNNVAGTARLLDAARRAGVEQFVFSSTCAVYGTPERTPVSENAPLHPESPYGESKALVERMLRWFDTSHDFRSVSLRYFNAAGAAMDGTIGEDWTVSLNLVPLAMKALLGAGPPLAVFGTDYPTPDGTAIRDYIHVEDLADAHLKALDHLERGGATDVFNLGTGTGSSVRQVLDTAGKVAGRAVPSHDAPRRPGDPVGLWADNAKARRVLGWNPRYGLEDIVSSAWAWHSGRQPRR